MIGIGEWRVIRRVPPGIGSPSLRAYQIIRPPVIKARDGDVSNYNYGREESDGQGGGNWFEWKRK